MTKKLLTASLTLKALTLAILWFGAPLLADTALKIGVVDFKKAVETSKAGKQEQANFESLKKQMETVLEEKESKINEIAAKFNDPDYLDSLSTEAENELKHKFRVMSQELTQIQGQYYETLRQANVKILQDLKDFAVEASKELGLEKKFDFILDEEGIFFFLPHADATKEVVAIMDKRTDENKKEAPKK